MSYTIEIPKKDEVIKTTSAQLVVQNFYKPLLYYEYVGMININSTPLES
jgi:hypothetical protein